MTTPKQPLIEPLDFLLLEKLPIEGTMAFGVYPQGALASDLRDTIADGKLSISAISTRLRVLRLHGLVTSAKGLSSRSVWQRTPAGDKKLKEWRGSHVSNHHL